MPLTPLNPPRISPVGKDASGKPFYQGKDGVPIYGLKDARAFQNYNKARGVVTRMPDMTSPTFGGYSMGRGWKDQRSQPKGVRNEKGDRVVLDEKGNQVPVGNRINARAGNKAVEARDAENAKFFNRARAVDQAQRPSAQPAPPQQARPLKDFETTPYSQKPNSVNDPIFQKKGNVAHDNRVKTQFEKDNDAAWARQEAQGQAPAAQAAPASPPSPTAPAYDPETLAKVRSAGKIARGREAFSKYQPEPATPYAQAVKRRKPGQAAVAQPIAPYANVRARFGSAQDLSRPGNRDYKVTPATQKFLGPDVRKEMDASQQAATAHLR